MSQLTFSSSPLTVSELTAVVKQTIRAAPHLAACQVRGELSNFRTYSSGHSYFTLKDAGAELAGVLFRQSAAGLRFAPTDGMAVIVTGRIDVYERRGQYQLIAQSMVHDGQGTLHQAFARLRDKLADEGLFEAARKRPLPTFPKAVGIITSPSGAALRDMVRRLRERWPPVDIVVIPSLVQGEQAAASLVRALELANATTDLEVILFGRGGGSLEDLWPFNEEPVARALAASRLPVISAVGHETDLTISDLVADVRAATPTHAAELAVPDRDEVGDRLAVTATRLQRTLTSRLRLARAEFEAIGRRPVVNNPLALLTPLAQATDDAGERLQRAMVHRWQATSRRLDQADTALRTLDPEGVLRRGYAIFCDAGGQVVSAASQVAPGDRGTVRTGDGDIPVIVAGETDHA